MTGLQGAAVAAAVALGVVIAYVGGSCRGPDLERVQEAIDSTADANAVRIGAARGEVIALRDTLERHTAEAVTDSLERVGLAAEIRRLHRATPGRVVYVPTPAGDSAPATELDTLRRRDSLQGAMIGSLEGSLAAAEEDRRRAIRALGTLEVALDSIALANRRLDSLGTTAVTEAARGRRFLGFIPPPSLLLGGGTVVTPSGQLHGGAIVGIGWNVPLHIGPWRRQ